jgi:hypothetical protein
MKYKITDADGSMVWIRSASIEGALARFALKYYKVTKAKLFVRQKDAHTYTLHQFHKGKIKQQYFAEVVINAA